MGGTGMKGGVRLGVTATLAAAQPRQRIDTGRGVGEWAAAGALVAGPLGRTPAPPPAAGRGEPVTGRNVGAAAHLAAKGRRLRGRTHPYESCYERGPSAYCHRVL